MDNIPQPRSVGQPIHFYRIGSEAFEYLTRDLIREEPYVKQAFKYGRRGQSQRGIDIFSITKNGNGIVVGQAKAYEKVTKADIESAVTVFRENIDYWKKKETRYFILTYGSEITDKDAEEYINEQYDRFLAEEIVFDVWDSNEIESKISKSKSCELIFQKYFQEVAELYIKKYCVITPRITSFQRKKSVYIDDHIDRIVSRQKNEGKFDSQTSIESLELFTVIEEESRILLLADAGVGKTQELKSLYNRVYKESNYTPVLIPLRSYTDKAIEYYLSGEEIDSQEKLVILFDGLDEIKPEHKSTFLNKLEEFSSLSLSRIVLSCRTNHFEDLQISSSSEMSGFQTYYLNKLKRDQSLGYLNEVNTKLNREIVKPKNHDLLQLLESPFYLKKIISYYKENSKLPKSNKLLFTFLIDSRLDQYFKKKGFEIQKQDKKSLKDRIIGITQRVALSFELTGKNYCDSKSIHELLTREELDLLLTTSLLVSDTEEGALRFEHRQIQEFFAALALSNTNLETIKTFISIPPSFREILPSWYNTIGMLMTLIDEDSEVYSDLINYLLDRNTEVFIYLERDRLNEELSLKILQSMIDEAKRKGIGLSISFFEIDKLSKLTDYRKVQEYLINELSQDWEESSVIADIITITEYTSFLNKKWIQKICNILIEKILNKNTQETLIWKSIYTISGIGFSDKAKIETIVTKLGESESDSIRSSIYKLIEETGNQVHFKEYVYSELKKYSKNRTERLLSSKSSLLLDISFNLSSLILNIEKPKDYIEYVEFLSANIKVIDELLHDFLSKLIQNGVQHYKRDKNVLDAIINLYIGLVNSHFTNRNDDFISFFEQTDTKGEALIALLDRQDSFRNFSAWHILPLLEKSSVDYLLEYFGQKRENDLHIIIGILDGIKEKFGRPLFFNFKEKLEERRGESLDKPDAIDWNKQRKDENRRTIEVIFSKKEFLKDVDKVFNLLNELGGKEKKKKDIWLEAHKRPDVLISDTVLQFVEDYFEKGIYERSTIYSDLEKRVWSNWSAWEFYSQYINGNLSEEGIERIHSMLNAHQINLIKEWCINNISNYDFKKAMKIKNDGYSTILWYPILIWMYQRIFDFKFDKDVFKNMIAFDYYDVDKRELKYYENYLSVDEIMLEVISNLEDDIRDTFVVKKHLNYLYEKENVQLHYFLERYLLASESNDALKSHCLELLLKSNKGLDIAVKSLESVEGEFYWKAVDRITNVEKISKVENLLIRKLNESDEEKEKINASVRLMRFSNIDGLKYYITKTKEDKRYPEYDYMYIGGKHLDSPVSLYNDIKGLPLLIDFLGMEYEEEFKTDRFNNVASVVIGALKKIAVASYSNFETVYSELEAFIQKHAKKNTKVRNLYWSLDSISKEFYLNYSRSISLKKAAKRVKELMG